MKTALQDPFLLMKTLSNWANNNLKLQSSKQYQKHPRWASTENDAKSNFPHLIALLCTLWMWPFPKPYFEKLILLRYKGFPSIIKGESNISTHGLPDWPSFTEATKAIHLWLKLRVFMKSEKRKGNFFQPGVKQHESFQDSTPKCPTLTSRRRLGINSNISTLMTIQRIKNFKINKQILKSLAHSNFFPPLHAKTFVPVHFSIESLLLSFTAGFTGNQILICAKLDVCLFVLRFFDIFLSLNCQVFLLTKY